MFSHHLLLEPLPSVEILKSLLLLWKLIRPLLSISRTTTRAAQLFVLFNFLYLCVSLSTIFFYILALLHTFGSVKYYSR